MIGLIAALLAGIVLKEWVFGLAVVPYILRLKGRNPSLMAFYSYVLAVILKVSGASVYTHEGLVAAIATSASTFLLLDEVLRGIKIGRTELVLSALLLVSAIHDYAFVTALIAVTTYVVYLRFGQMVYYLSGWMVSSAVVLYVLRGHLSDPVAQSFVIIGLGLIFLLFSERNEVGFLEVGLFEEE